MHIGDNYFAAPTEPKPLPHQLRAPVGDFVGRENEISQIVKRLRETAGNGGAAIGAIFGMGGIGKTELAYMVAHRLTPAFPNAQLFIELRGASSNPLSPTQALQTVIRAFDQEVQLSDDMAELQSAYRTHLSGKRVLILADDAKDAAQVRPLLPPAGSVLLITSRTGFSLSGTHTKAVIELNTLSPVEAEQLLLSICPRIGKHATSLAKECGYLPLALRVSAGTLQESTQHVPDYLERLKVDRLKLLKDSDTPDDPETSVEASLLLSYNALELTDQQALCQLSVFPASFQRFAALEVVQVNGGIEDILNRLYKRSLLKWNPVAERYDLHDLVRAFGLTRLLNADVVRQRHAQHYAKMARIAKEWYTQPGATTRLGLVLFDQERLHIDAGLQWTLAHIGNPETDALLLEYVKATSAIGDLRYNIRHEWIPQLEAGLTAARQLEQKDEQSWLLLSLGEAHLTLGEPKLAIEYIDQARAIAHELNDRRAEGDALRRLGDTYVRMGEVRQSIAFSEQALAIAHELNASGAESLILGSLGNAHWVLGDAHKAIEYYEKWLKIARARNDQRSEGYALGNLGSAHWTLGEVHKAIEYFEQDLKITRELRDQGGVATASWNMGIALEQQGELERAVELMQVAVDYKQQIDHPDAEKDAAYLAQLRQRLTGSTPLGDKVT